MRISKFGGGILTNLDSFFQLRKVLIENVSQIVVVSALGKTTNALKDLAEGYIRGDKNMMNDALDRIRKYNLVIEELFSKGSEVQKEYQKYIDFLENLTQNKPFCNSPEMICDRIMVFGENISSLIVSQFLNDNSFPNKLVPADSFIRTDMNFGSANVLEEESMDEIRNNPSIRDCVLKDLPIVTQGFIARASVSNIDFTFDGPTTMGRESSDYTAALIAKFITRLKIAEVKEVVLWKDVYGVANQDPKRTPKESIKFFPVMSYDFLNTEIQPGGKAEGLVHSKTVKVLKEQKIPLLIKNFWHPELPGTLIH